MSIISVGSRDDAQQVANRIMDYWACRGFVVNARVERITTTVPSKGEVVDPEAEVALDSLHGWGVRTDMINGWPAEVYYARKRAALAA